MSQKCHKQLRTRSDQMHFSMHKKLAFDRGYATDQLGELMALMTLDGRYLFWQPATMSFFVARCITVFVLICGK